MGSIFCSSVVLGWTFNTRGVYNFITKKANIPVSLVLFFYVVSFLSCRFLKSGVTNELKSLLHTLSQHPDWTLLDSLGILANLQRIFGDRKWDRSKFSTGEIKKRRWYENLDDFRDEIVESELELSIESTKSKFRWKFGVETLINRFSSWNN